MPFANRTRLDEAYSSLCGPQATTQSPFESCFRMEYAREWGPCVLGIDQAMRGPLSAIGPAVFCGTIVPLMHEAQLEAQGIVACSASSLSGNDQERLAHVVQSDSYIAWLLRVIPSEAADGARCSMGVLEHTTAASIIKEAIAAGVEVRSIRVCATCDPTRFRQFLFEAFPMIDDISVYPRCPVTTATTTATSCGAYCGSVLLPSSPQSPQSLPSSPLSPTSAAAAAAASIVPPVICAAGVVAQRSRDILSRQLLYRQRQSPSPLSRSPLSKPVNTCPRRRDHRLANNSAAAASFFSGPLFRCRSSSEENTHKNVKRCAAFAGCEFGESHCGLVSEMPPPRMSQSQNIPIEMYDFYGEDDASSMEEFTSPKRIRVVPCSPPLPTVISSEDSLPCVSHPAPIRSCCAGHTNSAQSVDSFVDSSSFSSTSLLVSPPPFVSSTSTSVPMYRPMYGLTSPF